MTLEYETSQEGMLAVFKDWQIVAMRVLWDHPDGANSRTVYDEVNKRLSPSTISRASVINFLNAMLRMGVLSGIEETGRGGTYLTYSAAMKEAEFKRFVAETILGSLLENFPDETRAALAKYSEG